MSVNEAGDEPAAAECFKYVPRGYNCIKVYMLVIISLIMLVTSIVGLFLQIYSKDEGMKYMWASMLSGVLMFWVPPPRLMREE